MPHPDEGMIHAWLDGELDAAETARVEALIASDPAWSAAAAEARGLTAASSRIVRALDHLPAQVAPTRALVPRRRSRRWWTVRVAALLVVVAGTTLVLREGGPERALQVAAEPGGEPPVANTPLNAAKKAPPGLEPKSPEGRLAASAPPLPGSAGRFRAANVAPRRVAAFEQPSAAAGPSAPPAGAVAAPSVSVAATRPAGVRAGIAGAPAADSSAESSAKMTDSPVATRCFELREPSTFAGRIVRHPPDSLSLADWQLLAMRPEQLVERGDSLISKPGAERRVVAVRVPCPPKP